MFEGHDTTQTSINWTLHLLGCNPDIQEKCYKEIQTVCGDSTYIDSEALGKLTYLECCIKESLRIYPRFICILLFFYFFSVPIIARMTGEDVKYLDCFVPKNTQILINIFLIHRDPEHWSDPETYDPDRYVFLNFKIICMNFRFLQENLKGRHPFAYIPFSAGSRNCIGQRFALLEEKTIISYILRNFKVKSFQRRDQVRHKTELILRPFEPIPLELTPRDEWVIF